MIIDCLIDRFEQVDFYDAAHDGHVWSLFRSRKKKVVKTTEFYVRISTEWWKRVFFLFGSSSFYFNEHFHTPLEQIVKTKSCSLRFYRQEMVLGGLRLSRSPLYWNRNERIRKKKKKYKFITWPHQMLSLSIRMCFVATHDDFRFRTLAFVRIHTACQI